MNAIDNINLFDGFSGYANDSSSEKKGGVPWVTFLLGALGLAANTWNQEETNRTNKEIAEKNLDFQKAAQDLNLELTRESWARDDNALRRRLADAKAAGINPLYVLGGAGNSSPIKVEPQVNTYQRKAYEVDPLGVYGRAISMSQDFALKSAEIDKTRNEAYNLTLDSDTKQTYNATLRAGYGSKLMESLDKIQQMYSLGQISKDRYTGYLRIIGRMFSLPDNSSYQDIYMKALEYSLEPLMNYDGLKSMPSNAYDPYEQMSDISDMVNKHGLYVAPELMRKRR